VLPWSGGERDPVAGPHIHPHEKPKKKWSLTEVGGGGTAAWKRKTKKKKKKKKQKKIQLPAMRARVFLTTGKMFRNRKVLWHLQIREKGDL